MKKRKRNRNYRIVSGALHGRDSLRNSLSLSTDPTLLSFELQSHEIILVTSKVIQHSSP